MLCEFVFRDHWAGLMIRSIPAGCKTGGVTTFRPAPHGQGWPGLGDGVKTDRKDPEHSGMAAGTG